jgi:hypothetical protein
VLSFLNRLRFSCSWVKPFQYESFSSVKIVKFLQPEVYQIDGNTPAWKIFYDCLATLEDRTCRYMIQVALLAFINLKLKKHFPVLTCIDHQLYLPLLTGTLILLIYKKMSFASSTALSMMALIITSKMMLAPKNMLFRWTMCSLYAS